MNIFKKFLVFFAILLFSFSFIACEAVEDKGPVLPSPSSLYEGWTMEITAYPAFDAENKFDFSDITNNNGSKITFIAKVYNSDMVDQEITDITWTYSDDISAAISFPFSPKTHRLVFNINGLVPTDTFTLKADFNGIISSNTYSFK